MAQQWRAENWGAPSTWTFAEVTTRPPGAGEVTITVAAAGVNPVDYKQVAAPAPGRDFPVLIGNEVSGTLAAIGPDTEIASGGGAVGDPVVAFRISGGYATEITVPAKDVFAKPSRLSHEEAANLLLVGTTAAQMLDSVQVHAGNTILLHGASGAVGVSVLQQAAEMGVRVIGTASESSFARIRRFGGTPVAYGPELLSQINEALDGSVLAAALDAVGTDEAIDISLELVPDRNKIVTVVNAPRAAAEGFRGLFGNQPESLRFRDEIRPRLLALAESGRLQVPIARTFPLRHAPDALALVATGHAGGKIALTAG